MARLFRAIKNWFQRHAHEEDVGSQIDDTLVTDYHDNETDYRVWLPSAENIHKTENIKMKTRGEYKDGYPQGLIVHFTAGWRLKRGNWPMAFPVFTDKQKRAKLEKMARDYALRTARGGAKNGYNFLVMDVFGNIYQSRPLTKHGYHAGKSYWKGLGHSVSSKLAGVEILNAGKLTEKNGKFKTWYGLEVNKEHVREHIVGGKSKGFWMKYTREQEESLKRLCAEMRDCSPLDGDSKVFSYDYVLGHDEVAPKRKNDPMGSLSTSMVKFREMLHKEVK